MGAQGVGKGGSAIVILRRVIEHVKAQNWTAVALDFLIVVLGVFIGIQVSNWNDWRLARSEKARLLTQLSNEVDISIELLEGYVRASKARREIMGGAIILASGDADGEFSVQQCEELWTSHIQYFQNSNLTTLDEIIATGGLKLIDDNALRSSLIQFRTDSLRRTRESERIADELAVNADEFPEAFKRRLVPENLQDSVECDLAAIRNNQKLLNRLMSNAGRIGGLIERAENEVRQLKELSRTLHAVEK